MFSRYQCCQFPALSPPRSSSADLAGSNAKITLISGRPAGRPGPEFYQVMESAAFDPGLDQGPAGGRPLQDTDMDTRKTNSDGRCGELHFGDVGSRICPAPK